MDEVVVSKKSFIWPKQLIQKKKIKVVEWLKIYHKIGYLKFEADPTLHILCDVSTHE